MSSVFSLFRPFSDDEDDEFNIIPTPQNNIPPPQKDTDLIFSINSSSNFIVKSSEVRNKLNNIVIHKNTFFSSSQVEFNMYRCLYQLSHQLDQDYLNKFKLDLTSCILYVPPPNWSINRHT